MAKKMFDFDVTLSLFDGISCGQEALKKAGITTRIYLASEIEKAPKLITRKNHPLTVMLGDVRNVKGENLPKIDLLLAGSPCQGFSKANNKHTNFEHPQSKLFFEFIRILKECKPKYFLLENVQMKQEHQDTISSYLGIKPQKINSSLFTAQNRVRLYWWGKKINNQYVQMPINPITDKEVLLNQILEERQPDLHLKNNHANISINNDKKILTIKEATKKGYTEIKDGDCFDATFLNSKTRRGRNMKYKSNCLTAANYDYMRYEHPSYRKLTVNECLKLQTLPDNYLDCVDDKGKEISNNAKFKALGNGWTVDVITHIFKGFNNYA